jgi:ketosteroid isomerase-like protein
MFMAKNASALIGRDAVQASYQHIFETIKLKVVFTIHEIVEMGALAYGRTTSAGQQEFLANHSMSKEANNELFIFRKEQGQ